ncbi:MAG TPA: hypothetical protein DGR79_02350 [Clostridiales bacterium]|nr:hypothetical protein [Clostridiales bacterium]
MTGRAMKKQAPWRGGPRPPGPGLAALDVLVGFVTISFLEMRAYMGSSALRLVQYPVKLVVMYFLWRAVTGAAPGRLGLDFDTLTAYYAISILIGLMYSFRRVAAQTEHDIRTYAVDLHLCRPLPYWVKPAAPMVLSLAGYLALALPCGLAAFTLLRLPLPDPERVLAAVTCLLAAVPLRFLVWYIIGLSAFWTEETSGLANIFSWVESLLSGMLIPFALLPSAVAAVARWLPFQAYAALPIEVALGLRPPVEVLGRVGALACWTVLLMVAGRAVWVRGRRAYQSGGG